MICTFLTNLYMHGTKYSSTPYGSQNTRDDRLSVRVERVPAGGRFCKSRRDFGVQGIGLTSTINITCMTWHFIKAWSRWVVFCGGWTK